MAHLKKHCYLVTNLFARIDHVIILKQNRKVCIQFFPERFKRLQSSGSQNESANVAAD